MEKKGDKLEAKQQQFHKESTKIIQKEMKHDVDAQAIIQRAIANAKKLQ